MKKMKVWMTLVSVLLLASCNGAETPSTVNSISGTVVEGDVRTGTDGTVTLVTKAWTGGAGVIIASTPNGNSPKELTRATLTANGKFDLSLVAPSEDQLFDSGSGQLVPECTGTISLSDPTVRGTELSLNVDANKDGTIAPLAFSTLVEGGQVVGAQTTGGGLIYVDRDVTFKGKQTCKFDDDTVVTDTDVSFKKGWNKAVFSIQQNTSTSTRTYLSRNGDFPNNWVYIDASAQPLGLRNLKASEFQNFSLFR